MRLQVLETAEAAALAAAAEIAAHLALAIEQHKRASLALSGGRSPAPMLAALARTSLPWPAIDILQVDERIAPAGNEDRNANTLRTALLEPAAVPADRIHLMPVEETDLTLAAVAYARTLERLAGTPPRIDVVHLGLGADGHTASLVPGDAVLDEIQGLVALTQPYQGRRRMTLTYPALAGARRLVWLVIGADKADALRRLWDGDATIPAGRVERRNAIIFADAAAGSWYAAAP